MKPDLTQAMSKLKQAPKSSIGELIGCLFSSRDKAHIEHLKTTSYAAHKALGDYYDGILDLTDTLVETYQGEFGLISKINIKVETFDTEDFTSHLKKLAQEIRTMRTSLGFNSHLTNITDEILELIFKTVYKLTFLK